MIRKPYTSLVIAGVLVLAGLFLSAGQIAWVFRGGDPGAAQDLATGVLLFKIGLVVCGTYMFLLRLLPAYVPVPMGAHAPPGGERHETLLLVALLICAAGLRLYSLGTGIWYDEMLTYVNYMPLSVGQIVSTYHDANNHILFSVFARLSLSGFGDTVWAFRLPAVVFGVGSIAALYYLARKFSTVQESLFSVALLTFSYHHIWFSQNARGYTALLFFTLLSSTLLMNALRRNNPQTWVLYSLAAVLGAVTHLTMGLVVFSHFIIYAAWAFFKKTDRHPQPWIGFFYGFIPVGLLTYQTHALILPSMLGGGLLESGLQGEDGIEWTNPVWAIMEVVNALQIGFASGGIALVAVTVFGIGMIDFLRRTPEIVGFLMIPTVVGLLLMTSIGYTLFPRFFFFAMGFGVIIVIHGGAVTGRIIGRLLRLSETGSGWIATALCAGIVIASLPPLRHVYFPKQDFASAIDLIEAQKQADDTVITLGIADFPFNKYYRKDWENVETLAEFEQLRATTKRTWLVYTLPVQAQSAYPDILQRLDEDYIIVDTFYGTLNGGEVVVCLEKTPETS